MRSSTLSMALAGPLAVRAASSTGTGTTTRYWDCCKPSCAWDGKASVSAPVLTCDASDNPISDASAKSGCDGGTAYTCSDNSPWAVNSNLAYGFAATNIEGGSESSWCCSCYALTFTSGAVKGKTMIVQSTNTGSDLGSNQFDLLIPGGGVGIFNGCTSEFGSALPGEQYGGISSASQCSTFPTVLQDGCEWRFDWFQGADNPTVSFERVQCPKAITDVSGCIRDDESDYAVFSGATGSSSGSSSTSAAAAASSQTSTEAATKASTTTAASQETEAADTTTSTTESSTSQSSAAQSSAAQSSAAENYPVEPETTTTAPTSTQTPTPAQTKTRTRSKGACAARKSSASSKATDSTLSTESVSDGTVALYHQCNGSKASFPNGAMSCASGSTCVYVNDYYSQCQAS